MVESQVKGKVQKTTGNLSIKQWADLYINDWTLNGTDTITTTFLT